MPHKHTRRKESDHSGFDLAPSVRANPLPSFRQDTRQRGQKRTSAPDDRVRKRQKHSSGKDDDTPRAFARLMARQSNNKQQFRSGLDDGQKGVPKKRHPRVDPEKAKVVTDPIEDARIPAILPGERLSDYSARVDRALPVAGLARKGKLNVEGIRERQTKTEKRLQKMYAEWREQDSKRKERLEEWAEQQEADDDEKSAALGVGNLSLPLGKRTRRQRMLTEQDDGDEDPWAILKERRGRPQGLHDVAQAPPTLKPMKEKFKTKNGAKINVLDVPNAAGSLKKREELGEARREIIDRYRAMMKANRA